METISSQRVSGENVNAKDSTERFRHQDLAGQVVWFTAAATLRCGVGQVVTKILCICENIASAYHRRAPGRDDAQIATQNRGVVITISAAPKPTVELSNN